MRNFKRVLSLALAVVMVIGMMVMGAGAAGLTDYDEITYKEAVSVAQALEIIDGLPNGAFNPKGQLTREGAAILICRLVLGRDASDKLVGVNGFQDVAASWYSAGQIEFCANNGYIGGMPDGNFHPTAPMVTYGFGKLLLCALGYDAEIEQYGDAKNIKADMAAAKIAQAGIDLDAILTREVAAQLLWNTMNATKVETVAGSTISIGGVEIVTGATVKELTGQSYLADAKTSHGLDKVADTDLGDLDDDFGRPAKKAWALGNEDPFYVEYEKPVAVYTAPVKAADIAKAYAKYTWASGKAASDIVSAADYGVVVEVYADSTKKVTDIVVIEETLGKVTKVTEAKDDAERYVTVAGMKFETEDFAKGDAVLYTAGSEIQSMVAAKTVVGKITSYNDETVTIGGKTYNYGHDFSLTANFLKDYVFTLYSDGSIAAQVEKAAADADVSTDYVYVTKVEYQKWVKDSGSLLGDKNAKDPAAKAEVIFTDGSKAVIDLTITNTEKDATKDPTYVVDAPAAGGTVAEETALDDTLVNADGTIGNWFAYTIEDDETYTLTAVDPAYATVKADGVSLTKDEMTAIGTKFTTADTVITSVDSKYVTSVKTGFVKATLTGKVLVTYAKGSNSVAALYAVGQTPATAPADTTTYYAVESGNNVKGGTEWTFAAKGEQVTLVVKDGETISEGGFYTLTAGKDEDAGLYTVKSVEVANALVTLISGDQVAFSDGSIKVLAETYNVYNIDDTADVAGEVKELEVGDVIYYTVNADKEITNIWVYGVEGTVDVEDVDELKDAVATAPIYATIKLAEGEYELEANERLFVSKPLTILSDGDATIVGSSTTADWGGMIYFQATSAGATLKDVTLEFASTSRDSAAVYFEGVTGSAAGKTVIKNVVFQGAATLATIGQEIGVLSTGAGNDYVEITDCSFTNFKYGMYLNQLSNAKIANNDFDGTNYNGINLTAGAKVTISDNSMKNISAANANDADYGATEGTYTAGIFVGAGVTEETIEGNSITMLNSKKPIYNAGV